MTCEPCAPVGSACQPSSAMRSRQRTAWSRSAFARDRAVEPRDRASGRRVGALERAQRRPREQLERDHRRDRVARQPERVLSSRTPNQNGLPGLRRTPQTSCSNPELEQCALHVVVWADGHAAGDAQHVGVLERAGERVDRRGVVVARAVTAGDFGACALRLRRERRGIRIVDLPRAERLPGGTSSSPVATSAMRGRRAHGAST